MKREQPMCRRVLWVLLAFFSVSAAAYAHDPALSGIKFIRAADGVMVVSVVTHISRLNAPDMDNAIRRRLKVRFDGHSFTPGKSHLSIDKSNDLLTWQAEYHRPVKSISVLQRLYREDPASHFSVVVFEHGRVTQQALLDAEHPDFGVAQAPAKTLDVIGSFLREGVSHIFGGFDHVCFVLGLLLFGGTLTQLLKTVTAFTVAHSLTLSLAVMGIWSPPSRVVEPLIALSIVFVAAENLRRTPLGSASQRDWHPYLAFSFGLVHGFGFAGALREVGLPREALGWALGSFNVGVELGQACIILVAAPLLAWVAGKSVRAHRCIVLAGSGGIAVLGVCWFVQRVGIGG